MIGLMASWPASAASISAWADQPYHREREQGDRQPGREGRRGGRRSGGREDQVGERAEAQRDQVPQHAEPDHTVRLAARVTPARPRRDGYEPAGGWERVSIQPSPLVSVMCTSVPPSKLLS